MAHRTDIIHITPKVLDFGSRVVALHQVTSVASVKSRPLMPLGLLLLLGGAALVGYEVVLRGVTDVLKGGSTRLWLALVASGLGIFAQVYQRRGLIIALADRDRIHINANRDDFCLSLVTRIGEAMRARPDANLHYIVDVDTQTIDIAAPDGLAAGPVGQVAIQPAAPPAGAPPERRPELPPAAAAAPPSWTPPGTRPPAQGASRLPHEPLPHESVAAASTRNGAAGQAGATPARFGSPPAATSISAAVERSATQTQTQQSSAGAQTRPPYLNGNGAAHPASAAVSATPGPGPLASLSTLSGLASPPAQTGQDLDSLIEFVRHADVQHKDALLNLLGVVDDYVKGGPTHQDDAVEHWKSFSSYVHQYLTDVDGLTSLTDRAGRRLEGR